MRNKSFKMSIINDYTLILSSKNFCDFSLSTLDLNQIEIYSIKEVDALASSLLQTYKKIMFKLGLIDLSLALLDKQMLNSYLSIRQDLFADKTEIIQKITEIKTNLTQIAQNLKFKIKKMELNNFELNYLNIDKISKISF